MSISLPPYSTYKQSFNFRSFVVSEILLDNKALSIIIIIITLSVSRLAQLTAQSFMVFLSWALSGAAGAMVFRVEEQMSSSWAEQTTNFLYPTFRTFLFHLQATWDGWSTMRNADSYHEDSITTQFRLILQHTQLQVYNTIDNTAKQLKS